MRSRRRSIILIRTKIVNTIRRILRTRRAIIIRMIMTRISKSKE